MKSLVKRMSVACLAPLLFPFIAFAGLDDDLNRNLTNKTKCLKSWHRDKQAFKLYFDGSQCKQGEATTVLLTVRAIYESDNARFPKKVVIDYGDGRVESYPFSNIPSLTK